MYGLLKDKGIMDEYDWWRSYPQNIDPSFSEPLPSQTLIDTNFLGDDTTTTAAWIKDGDLPDIEPYLQLQKIGTEEGPWIALDGHVNQENKDLKRGTFLFVRSFLVATTEKDEIMDFLSKQDMSGDWLPGELNFPQTFFAEIPWSFAFPEISSCDLSFIIGENVITCQRPKVEIVRNDQGFSIITHDEMEEYEEVQSEYKTFKAIMPVCSLSQDVTNGEVGGASSLTKKLTADMELIGQPQSFDLYTKCGKKVNHYISHKGKGYNDRHSMYYIREDILDNFIKKNNMTLIWVIRGERNYSATWPHVKDDSLPSPSYVVFGYAKEHCTFHRNTL